LSRSSPDAFDWWWADPLAALVVHSYYGMRMTLKLSGALYASMVIASLAVNLTFRELGLGSSANAPTDEFLGDYVSALAARTYGAAVWNDTRRAQDCPAIDAWRMALQTGNTSVATPAPQQDCPATFGNSDIFGGSYPDPTP
jgi:hypothetical protein